jgi:hypothetical protein
MTVSANEHGLCPSCGARGEVGDACAERICGRFSYRFIPGPFVTWSEREPPPSLVGRTVGKA